MSAEEAFDALARIERVRRKVGEVLDAERDQAAPASPVDRFFADLNAHLDQAINHAAHPLRQVARDVLNADKTPIEVEASAQRTWLMPTSDEDIRVVGWDGQERAVGRNGQER